MAIVWDRSLRAYVDDSTGQVVSSSGNKFVKRKTLDRVNIANDLISTLNNRQEPVRPTRFSILDENRNIKPQFANFQEGRFSELLQQQQDLNRTRSTFERDANRRDVNSSFNRGIQNLALNGGIRGGARERLQSNGQRALLQSNQTSRQQQTLNDLIAQTQSTQLQENARSTDIANAINDVAIQNKFDMDEYLQLLEIFGVRNEADLREINRQLGDRRGQKARQSGLIQEILR